MDCFLDFCLACDKQTTEGLYCSQACRLADLERAGSSAPTSPFSPSTSPSSSESGSRSYFPSSSSSGFHLPPALNFGKSSDSSTSPTHSPRHSVSSEPSSPRRSLTPSSSRSSLSSSSGTITGQSTLLSEQARSELQGYVSAFDQTRELKRRSLSTTTGY